jgi:hypothetical protein
MHLPLLISLAAAQQPFEHAAHHPQWASVYVECPDVGAALDAYERSAFVRMVRDEQVGQALDKVTDFTGVAPRAMFATLLAPLGVGAGPDDDALAQVLASVRTAHSFSFSVGMAEQTPGEAQRSMDALLGAFAELDSIAARVEQHQREHGAAPSALSEVSLDAALAKDPWERAYIYSRGDDGAFQLRTLGRDGAEGGVGVDADLAHDGNVDAVLMAEMTRRMGMQLVLRMRDETAAQRAHEWMLARAPLAESAPKAPEGWSSRAFEMRVFDSPLWVARCGTLLVLGSGATSLDEVAQRQQRRGPGLDLGAAMKDLEQRAGPQRGTLVLRGWGEQLTFGDVGAGTFADTLGMLETLSSAAGAWRMQLDGERFTTDWLSAPTGSDSLLALLGAAPAPRSSFAYVPSDAVGFFAAHLDATALRARVAQLFAGSEGADAASALAELESKYGFDLEDDVCANLSGGLAGYLLALNGIGLPNMGLVAELKDRAAFERGVRGLFNALAARESTEFTVKESKYRDAPMWTLNFAALAGDSQFAAFAPTPTLSIVGERVFITLTSLRAKKEIKAALAGEQGAHVVAQDAAQFSAEAGYAGWMDWATTLDSLYTTARSAAAMFGGQLPLPIDVGQLMTAMPESASVFTRFYTPTKLSLRAVDGRYLMRWDSSFGPETWLGLVALGLGVSVSGEAAFEATEPETAPANEQDEAARQATIDQLAAVSTRIAVFKLDQGRLPESLEELAKPTANYPRGFLEGLGSLQDAWGAPLLFARASDGASYRLWSAGPDGIDGDGQGDDLAP